MGERDVMEGSLTRRTFLRSGIGVGLGGAALPGLLGACVTAQTSSTAGRAVKLPTYVAPKLPPPQLAGDTAGVQNAYWQMPAKLVRSVEGRPGTGGSVTSLTLTYSTPPTPYSENAYWKELNNRLGVNYQPTIVGASDFPEKMATAMASNQLPDFMLLYGGVSQYGAIPHVIEFMEAKCEDLTPYLSGDAVKAYPNLAALGDFAWSSTVYNGRIYALPIPSGVFWNCLFILQDLADQVGISQPKNADEFERLMTQLNRPKDGRWALGAQVGFSYNLNFFFQMFGVPNGWSVDKSGHFTGNVETAGAQEAIAFMRKLYQAGLFHPQAGSMTTVQAKNAFYAAQICAYQDGFGAYYGNQTNVAQTSGHSVSVVVPPSHNGGRRQYNLGIGTFAITTIPKASRSRVEELLRIANYLAAPFGSEENFFLGNGLEGIDFTKDAQGNPVQTPRGQSEVQLALGFITSPQSAVFTPRGSKYAKAIHDSEKALVSIGVANPTVGLYSPTNARVGSTLMHTFNDGASAIISGRAPMSSWKNVVQDWRSQGGDQIRKEYEQAYGKSKK